MARRRRPGGRERRREEEEDTGAEAEAGEGERGAVIYRGWAGAEARREGGVPCRAERARELLLLLRFAVARPHGSARVKKEGEDGRGQEQEEEEGWLVFC